MSMKVPDGWQWTTTVTGREQLEHVTSKFAFDVPQTDEYAQAMAAVVERYWASGRFWSIGQVLQVTDRTPETKLKLQPTGCSPISATAATKQPATVARTAGRQRERGHDLHATGQGEVARKLDRR